MNHSDTKENEALQKANEILNAHGQYLANCKFETIEETTSEEGSDSEGADYAAVDRLKLFKPLSELPHSKWLLKWAIMTSLIFDKRDHRKENFRHFDACYHAWRDLPSWMHDEDLAECRTILSDPQEPRFQSCWDYVNEQLNEPERYGDEFSRMLLDVVPKINAMRLAALNESMTKWKNSI